MNTDKVLVLMVIQAAVTTGILINSHENVTDMQRREEAYQAIRKTERKDRKDGLVHEEDMPPIKKEIGRSDNADYV